SGVFPAAGAGSGVFGGHPSGSYDAPSGGFGGHPSGRHEAASGAGSGVFGGHPSGSYDAPSGGFGGHPSGRHEAASGVGGFGARPSGRHEPAGSGVFGAHPSGRFGAVGSDQGAASGAHGAREGSSSGSIGGGGGGAGGIDLAALGLTGERYDIERRPAPGQWEARDRFLHRRVVLRVDEEAQGEEFWRHAHVLGRLDHAGVRRIHDVGTIRGSTFFSLDPIEGESLEVLLTGVPEERPGLPTLLRAFLGACAAVQHAHGRGIVHANLHPSRVRLGSFGQAWVTGWENARALETAAPELKHALRALPPVDSRDPTIAPELRRDGVADLQADVFGLGVVLHWILATALPGRAGLELQKARAPRELVAIATKALARDPDQRYYSVRALQEDVRRFIDGREVLAAGGEGPLRAALRLARRHPLATGVGALLGGVVLSGALVTFAMVRSRANAAQDRRQAAQAEADKATRAIERAQAAAAEAAARAARVELIGQGEAALAKALAAEEEGVASEAFQAAERLIERALPAGRLGPEEQELRQGLLARLYLTRGRRHLFDLRAPRPDLALEDFERLAALRADDPRALLLVYQAARRLPGRAAGAREAQALDALGRLAGGWATLAEVGRELPELEAKARQLAQQNPRRRVDPKLIEPRVHALERVAQDELPQVSQVRTLLGRLGIVRCVPGAHRSQKVLDEEGKLVRSAPDGTIKTIWRDLFWAILLDPTDPEPRAAYIPSFFAKWGAHAISRHKGGWPLGSLAVICRTALRPEPTLGLVEVLQEQGRYECTLPVLERALAVPHADARDPSAYVCLTLARARAQLRRGIDPEVDVSGLDLPPAFLPLRSVVAGWQRLRSDDDARGALERILDGAFALLEGNPVASPQLLFHDLCFALTEPHPRTREGLLQAIDGLLSRPDPALRQLQPFLLLGHVAQASALGRDVRRELQALYQAMQKLGWAGWGYQHGVLTLAGARPLIQAEPRHPAPHLELLRFWACMGMTEGAANEGLGAELQSLIVARLGALGNTRARDAFAAIQDPVRELSVPRAYTAPEVWDWQGRREGAR
ncbi:MAG: hypothetical protein AB7T09_03205, partial [Planctomycetota bacterium]